MKSFTMVNASASVRHAEGVDEGVDVGVLYELYELYEPYELYELCELCEPYELHEPCAVTVVVAASHRPLLVDQVGATQPPSTVDHPVGATHTVSVLVVVVPVVIGAAVKP